MMNPAEMFFEVDGPPRSYFELVNQPNHIASNLFRGVYETVVVFGTDEAQVRDYFEFLLRSAYQPDPDIEEGDRRTQFLVWRLRPTIEWRDQTNDEPGLPCKLRARLWISNWTFNTLTPSDPENPSRFVWKLSPPPNV